MAQMNVGGGSTKSKSKLPPKSTDIMSTLKLKSNSLGQAGLNPSKYTGSSSLGQAGLEPKKYTNKPSTSSQQAAFNAATKKTNSTSTSKSVSSYNGSIVDYMRATGQDSSYSNRAKLAAQYGITGYSGSANQNLQLLSYLQQPKSAPVPVSKPKPTAIVPTAVQTSAPTQPTPIATPTSKPVATSSTYSSWKDAFNRSKSASGYDGLLNGKNTRLEYNGKVIDTDNVEWINQALANGAKISKSNLHGVSNTGLRGLSIAALNGDKNAQAYLKAIGNQGMTGSGLWKDFNEEQFHSGSQALRAQYVKDNPYADITKKYEMNNYNAMSEWIENDKPIADFQMEKYNELVNKWNLDDASNPYVQAAKQLEKDKQAALSAQDVALNQGMAQMDTNSFLQFQQLQQGMSDRGISDSGIAADSYMRAQMANNANYQQAYANAATTKSDMQSQYNEAISNAKLGKYDYDMKLQQSQAENAIKLQEIQNDQDKWLTESTGSVFVNGQRIMVDGKPLTTVEWEKLSEEKRSNLANEAINGQKAAWDYELGMDTNAIKRQQIGVDLQIATSKMQLDYAKLDYNYAKLESNNAIAQDKIRIAAENAQTSADKSKITALGSQLNSLTKRIVEYQKAGKKPPKDLVAEYNNVNGQLQALAGNF